MKNRLILIILVLLPIAVCYNAGLLELRLEEPRRALVALEMLIRKSYIVPEINGELYYTKPPLFNWMIALAFWISGGYSEWAARLPGLLSYFATGLLLYWFAKKYFSKEKALLASLFFLTAADLLVFGTIISAEIDLFFAFIITAQQVLLYYFFSRERWLAMFAASYVFTALGVLTKGVPAVLFQGVSVVVICLYNRRYKLLFSWQHLAGILCFICVAGAYFYLYQQATGQLYSYMAKLYSDAAEKSVLEHSLLYSILNFLLSPVYLLRFFAPWFIYMLFLWKRKGVNYWQNNAVGFITWSTIVNIIPMLFTTETNANYIYPLFPFIAIIAAHVYLEYKDNNPRLNNILNKVFLVLMLSVVAGLAALPFFQLFRAAVPGFWYKTVLMILLVGGIAYYFHKTPTLNIYLLILFMVAARLLVSIYYLPVYRATSTQQHFASFIQTITKQAEGKQVYLGGAPVTQEAYLAIGPLRFDTVRISMPPFVQFQAPYYYTAINQKVMQYDPGMKKGNYYLLFTENRPDTTALKILNEYRPSARKKEMFYFVTPL